MSLSDHTQPTDQTQPTEPTVAPHSTDEPQPGAAALGQPVEIVSRGILFSLASIPVGIAAAVIISKLGFIASISSFLIAGSAVFLYVKGATTTPRRGVVPLIAVILVGVAASFLAIIAADLVVAYDTPEGQAAGYPSVVDFVTGNLFYGPVLKSYGGDLAMFLVFAALGVFGTVRRLIGARKGF